MSREIICKAKRKDNNQWIEGYYYKSWGCRNGIKYDTHIIHNYELDEDYIIDIDTLSWFIGKKDVDENKICENDIVETENGFQLQIVWNDEFKEFMYKNLNKGYDFMIGKVSELSAYTRNKNVKIIGNIFDGVKSKTGRMNIVA